MTTTTRPPAIKKGETTRIYGLIEVGTGPANLTGKVLTAKAHMADGNPLALTCVAQAQSGATLGTYYFEVTAANLTALANPASVTVTVCAKNADNSIFIDGDPAVLPVEI